MPATTSGSAGSKATLSSSSSSGSGSNLQDPLSQISEIVIIDNGAHSIRIASVPYPSTASNTAANASSVSTQKVMQQSIIRTYPNLIARTSSSRSFAAASSSSSSSSSSTTAAGRRTYISSQITNDLRDYAGLHLRQPHQKGVIVDWAAQKLIWDYVFQDYFSQSADATGTGRNASASSTPQKSNTGGKWLHNKAVILTESYFNLEEVEAATDLVLFEEYGAAAIWRTDPATLAAWTDAWNQQRTLENQASDLSEQQPQQEKNAGQDASSNATSTDPAAPTTEQRPAKRARHSRSSITSTKNDKSPRRDRPEVSLIVDMGYSYCHVIPIVRDQPVYASIKRLDIGSKILINLLKETISFKQLDMMEEFFLVSYIFGKTCFVGSCAGPTDRRKYMGKDPKGVIKEIVRTKKPNDWSVEDLLMITKYDKENPVRIEYVLPDYSSSSSSFTAATPSSTNDRNTQSAQERARYGGVVHGPCPESKEEFVNRKAKSLTTNQPLMEHVTDSDTKSHLSRNDVLDLEYDSVFIAGEQASQSSSISEKSKGLNRSSDQQDQEEEEVQSIILENERFSVLETLFNPSSIGLDQRDLSSMVLESVRSLPSSYTGYGDMFYSNILLIGGLANVPGIKHRLFNDLRTCIPSDIPIKITVENHPDLTPIKAAIRLVNSPKTSPQIRWLKSRFLSYNQWYTSQNPVELARTKFGKHGVDGVDTDITATR